ncbi:similar to Sec20 domain containing protein [Plenodomus lingam JN3]|uniref:Similar to Sec20 domain containing protein n=2 Tax=Leptosphaeria maculans TaxID=5022 RepID=E4ZV02_LEPMJ|nr:similar to Sec20 domain containing protein [Plenodomus lingam JN3]CBX95428.1 similar to Sec20 domain containing protein [Plenodomus lingam JN3]
MPPLPSTTQALTTRLTALSEANKAAGQLIHRLAKLEFQPGSLPLDGTDEGDVRLELSAEIHETLKGIEEDLELLRQEVEDITQQARLDGRRKDGAKENERNRLAVLLARLTEDLKSSRVQYRKAQLTAKHNADRAKLKERELLFNNLQSGSSTPSSTYRQRKQQKGFSEGEVVAQASSDVTAALRRTHQLMQDELSRSRFAQETLEQSTAALAELGEKYADLNTLLANSKALVTTLLQSTKSDTWYLETTFYVLITTVIWLVFRRWLYGPLTWFLIWPLKLAFRLFFALLPVGGGAASAAASSSPALSSSSSSSLIVKPSATGGIPRRNTDPNAPPHFVRVGGGGRGYMQGAADPSPPHSHSQIVGNMAEQQQDQQQEDTPIHPQLRDNPMQQGDDDPDAPVRRGDGTILEPGHGPRNPKKKMWDERVEAAKFEQQQKQGAQEQEGQAAQTGQAGTQQGEAQRQRDEL